MIRPAPKRAIARWCVTLLALVLGFEILPAAAASLLPPRVPPQDLGLQPQTNGERPHLRILVLGERPNPILGRASLEMSVLTDYAKAHYLELDWIPVATPEALYAALMRGEADIALGAMVDARVPRASLLNTQPLATWHYQLIGRNGLTIRDPLGLSGVHLGICSTSPLWSYFEKLRGVVPNLHLVALPEHLSREMTLRLVADGHYDATVLPITSGEADLLGFSTLKPLFDLTDDQPSGWYLRRDHIALLRSLNHFIARYHTANYKPVIALRNFAEIRRRGVLRIATRLDPENYFVDHGRPSGFEFELATAFAEAQGLKVQVLLAHSDEQMTEWLKRGAADLISGRIDAHLMRSDSELRFSRHYHHTAYVVLTGRDSAIQSTAALRGKRVIAYADSPELRAARSAADMTGLEVLSADRHLPARALLASVLEHRVDGLLVSGETANHIVMTHPSFIAGVSVPNAFAYRWTVRAGDPLLLATIDRFLVESHATGLDAILSNKYFSPASNAGRGTDNHRILSPFDPIMKTYADRYDFDWRLIAAQMFEESQFNPQAISTGGATGLMQMLPNTAKSLGFRNIRAPDPAIHAAVKYLSALRNEFNEEVPIGERTWFALAAYNAGRDRVQLARQLATKLHLDPNKWFGNVETAMLEFARPTDGTKPLRGYGQAIIYVREIQSLYGTYLQLGSVGDENLRVSNATPELGAYRFAMAP